MLLKFKGMKVILLYPFKSELKAQTLRNLYPPEIKPNIFISQILKVPWENMTEAEEIKTKNKQTKNTD